MRFDDCRRCLSLPTAVGDPDGVAAGCCFCFVFLGRVGPRSAGADGRVLGLTAFYRRRDWATVIIACMPSAGGGSDGVAAGCACFVVSFFFFFFLAGGTAAGCFICFAFFFVGPASLRIQLKLTAGWWDVPALFVRGTRRPS